MKLKKLMIPVFALLCLSDLPQSNILFATLTAGKPAWLLEYAGWAEAQSSIAGETLLPVARSGDYYSYNELPGVLHTFQVDRAEYCDGFAGLVLQDRQGSGIIHRAVIRVTNP